MVVEFRNHQLIALDSMIYIYLFEDYPKYADGISSLFAKIESGNLKAVSSEIARLEILTGAYKANDTKMINQYNHFFNTVPSLYMAPVDQLVANKAAEFRGLYGLKTPDSVHLATAIVTKADYFLSHDRHFKSIGSLPLEMITLDDII